MYEVVVGGGVADFLHIFANVRRDMDHFQSSLLEFFREAPT